MFDSFFDRAGESILSTITIALDECLKLNNRWLCTEHLLIALTREIEYSSNIASDSLTAMKLDTQAVSHEVENLLKGKEETEPLYCDRPEDVDFVPASLSQSNLQTSGGKPLFSQMAVEALRKAEDYSVYFGAEEIEPEHLLIAIMDLSECGALKVFDELSANLTYLRTQIIQEMAREAFSQPDCPNLYAVVKQGLLELLERYKNSANSLTQLAARGRQPMMRLPSRGELMHMIVIGYMSEFLSTQVAFQRYLLEVTIQNLTQRTGATDKELTASIVSTAAQNLRAEVRAIIEHVWLNE
ncbi:MAG TPA: Clp protease N-terminal domain-containing protein, partial [Chroococcales cyanobacterium]